MCPRRIEALADGVFAIAMTLLVIEIHVPHVAAPLTSAALSHALLGLAPHAVAYAVSFVILGTLWIGHHSQFHFLRRADRVLLWLNVSFLLCIAFLPFATALLATNHMLPVATSVYGGTLLAAGVFLTLTGSMPRADTDTWQPIWIRR